MTESNKRLFLLLGVAAVLLLVAVVLPKVLFGGDDGESLDDLSGPIVPAAVSGTPDAAVPATEAEAPVETFEVFTTKNPFTPLVTSEAAVPEQPTAAAPAVTPAPAPALPTPVATFPVTAPTFPAPVTAPAPAPATTPTTVPAPAPAPAAQPRLPQRVALLDVSFAPDGAARVFVKVNDVIHEIGENGRFATSYQVVEIGVDAGCAQFLFGDDRFRLCKGEAVLK